MGYAGGTLKRWDGAQWVGAAKLKHFDGTDWVHKPLYRWDGEQWLEVDTGRRTPADATGAFEVSLTTATIDHAQTGGEFTVEGTYGVS